ncbi:PPE domain-containing protein [Actinokineospora pegani]|uniref:PPE domain-containing protein n=1 Tax=Actinokineospora pegani TaxID=2654637 RepID=UPI0012EB0384|nr:PPE domain-containing protein [Actinokineospora pegani]
MRYNPDRKREYWRDSHDMSHTERHNAKRRRRLRKQNKEAHDFRQIRWEAYTHADLYNMVMAAKPEQMADRAWQWKRLSEQINQTTSSVNKAMTSLVQTWRGPAAVRAAESNTRLTQWADEAGHTAARVGAGMSDYATTVHWAQQRMPDPVFYYAEKHFMAGYDVKVGNDPAGALLLKQLTDDQAPKVEQRDQATAEAVRVMRQYGGRSQDVSDNLPQFAEQQPAPPRPPVEFKPRPLPPTQLPRVPVDPVVPVSPVLPTPVLPTSPDGNDTTTPGGYVPGGPGSPQGPGGTGYGPGGVPGAGGGFGPGGADGSRGPGGPSVGAFGAGGAGGPAEAGAGRGVGAGAGAGAGALGRGVPGAMAAESAAARGGAGMMGGMGAGAGARGDEDTEHENKYAEPNDFFDDLPPAYPSVFGA